MKKIFSIVLFLIASSALSIDFSFESKSINPETQQLTVHITLHEGESLYKDSLYSSIDNPYIELSSVTFDKTPQDKYDEVSKETKTIFENAVSLSWIATKKKEINDNTFLYITYQTNKQTTPQQKLFPIRLPEQKIEHQNSADTHEPINSTKSTQEANASLYLDIQSYTSWVSNLVEQTKSLPIRLLLVFLLGILLSFTPCIYPMIPITVGILQAHKSSSLFINFCHSLAYTFGLSITFAAFGLAASFTGPIYGKLLMSPISVGILVLFLAYLGFSMFGFYDVQLPKFFRMKNQTNGNGSLLSSFLFGTASGTIASPCVSPGLILLLSIVANLGSVFLGFLLLFVFGIGLSIPLLLIGTFSTSFSFLPKAGAWMIEIKKVFGLMLFGVCFYYLSNVMIHTHLMFLATGFFALLGIYYFTISQKHRSSSLKKYQTIIGFVSIISSITLFGFSLQEQFLTVSSHKNNDFWYTNYNEAKTKAQNENKLLFLDFWAEYCSICKSINKNVFGDPRVADALQKIVPVSINGTDDKSEPYHSLKKQFKIVGFPTFLVVDPHTMKVIKEWHSEVHRMPKEKFIEELLGRHK